MRFSDKIRKIVNTNKLGIDSPSALEEYIKAGKGAITTPLRDGEEPGTKTQKKIVDKLRINTEWWEAGKGPIFLDEPTEETSNEEPMKTLPLDAWDLLQKNFSQFEKNQELVASEVIFLREVIRNLTRGSVDSNKV